MVRISYIAAMSNINYAYNINIDTEVNKSLVETETLYFLLKEVNIIVNKIDMLMSLVLAKLNAS